jgi:AraC-like DNA-binding protein
VAANVLERFAVGPSLFGWSYSFSRPSPLLPWITLGIEIGVMLRGERLMVRADPERASELRYGRDKISVVGLGERYVTRFEPRGGPGREVGFVLRPDKDPAFADATIQLPRTIVADETLFALAIAVTDAHDRGVDAPPETAGEVRAFLLRHGELHPLDALGRAQLELHRHFAKPLYMRHFAEIAGVHEATFGRKFSARFGVTPTRYRTMLRLQEAAALLATERDLTVAEVAGRVGFEDVPYFHRAFATRLGAPPLRLARDMSRPPPRHSMVVPKMAVSDSKPA